MIPVKISDIIKITMSAAFTIWFSLYFTAAIKMFFNNPDISTFVAMVMIYSAFILGIRMTINLIAEPIFRLFIIEADEDE